MSRRNTSALILCIVFACLASIDGSNYVDHIAINCGSAESFNGDAWLGDDLYPKKLTAASSIAIGGSSSTTVDLVTSGDSVPYKTARVSRSKFSYRFQLDPGQKYIRLHFNPIVFKKYRDLFNVEANHFTLLSHFSPSIAAKHLGVGTFVKEFCVTTQENQPLDIVFSCSSDDSQSSNHDNYAFVNGIEIISIPAGSPYCHSGDTGVQVIGQKSVVYVDDNTALEMVQRHNLIAPRSVLPFHRTWSTRHSKEKEENTWKIPVDVGFRYLVKLHFAEVGPFGNFTILIDEIVACTDADIIQQRKELPHGVPWHKNYMVILKGSKKEDKSDILISIDGHIPLEGFEIFKLSNLDDSLASRNSFVPMKSSLSVTEKIKRTIALVVGLLCLINIVVFEFRQICVSENLLEEDKKRMDKHLCRYFSLAEIKSATKDFSDTLIIGRGSFGNVYKGLIDEENETVAIKRSRLRPDSGQGKHQFRTEIEMLSELRHVNLVSLIGYCNEEGEMILVYQHMPRGTLADYLYKRDDKISVRTSLSWKQRLLICIGAGRGLDYLHTGHRVMHRDVKSTNILLDEDFVAKLSDFGLAKTQIGRDTQTQDSTNMKGTIGYIDPNYCRTHTLTRKSDTYSFGVVLMEVLCGRKALDRSLDDDRRSLAIWALDNISKGDADIILDPRLRGQISPGSLMSFLNIAVRCLDDSPKKRPRMAHVVTNLEFALKLVHDNVNDAVDMFPCVCKVQLETTKTNERSSYRRPFSRKAFSNMLSVAAPRVSTTSQMMDSAPEKRNEKLLSKLKFSLIWPFDAFQNKAKSSKDFAAVAASAPLLHSRFDGKNALLPPSPYLKVFSFSDLKKATRNFSADTMIGQGGFGSVYKGWIFNTIVAIKKLETSTYNVLEQWQAEIEYLGRVSHSNLVKLLGYCQKKKQLLLVYEFIENGTLQSHLFGSADSAVRTTLSWDMRLKILTGVARGLAFLHHGLETKIIHRDIKPSNILLDESCNAKVSDFGLAKSGPLPSDTHVSTMVAGTLGYLDPEYFMTGNLYVKSDVYSFGICVLQVLTGLRAVSLRQSECLRKQILDQVKPHLGMEENLKHVIVDPRLNGNYPIAAACRIAELALNCVEIESKNRPSMQQAVEILESIDSASHKNRQEAKVRFVD